MSNFESGRFDFWSTPEAGRRPDRIEKEPIDTRDEDEAQRDLERVDNDKRLNARLAQLREQLSSDVDGIIHITIPAYIYDFAHNPFVGVGPQHTKTYEISRYIDVVFLHRFVYQDLIVCGVVSRVYVDEAGRKAFAKLSDTDSGSPDIVGQAFEPYMTYHTTDAFFRLYHTMLPGAARRPHWPLDVWLIFDARAYEDVDGSTDFRQAYRLRRGFDRRASLLGVAQIN